MKQGGVTNMVIEWLVFFVQKHGIQAGSETTFQDKIRQTSDRSKNAVI